MSARRLALVPGAASARRVALLLVALTACEHASTASPTPLASVADDAGPGAPDVGAALPALALDSNAALPALAPVVALDVACESCHSEIAAEWRSSVHARAATHPVYRAEHVLTNAAWCNRCHAPLADPAATGAAAERGVGCLLCHAPHDGHPHPEAPATRACASCHDAPFPTRGELPHAHYAPDQRLQRTQEEWLASAAATHGESCESCHFAEVRGAGGTMHTSHALPGGRDDALWRDALDVDATARRHGGGVRVRLTLRVRAAGHGVPTGDMYRRLLVRAEPLPAREDDEDANDGERILMRRFGPGPRGTRQIADDRVPADGTPRIVLLDLPCTTPRVRWSITWLALDEDLAAERHLAPELVRHDITSGELTVR